MTGKAPGKTSRKFGGVRAQVSGRGLDFLEVALVWKFPDRILLKQTSKKFASEPPKLLRSPSSSGSMGKLVLALSQFSEVIFKLQGAAKGGRQQKVFDPCFLFS